MRTQGLLQYSLGMCRALKIPRNMLELYKAPTGHSNPRFFFQYFLVSSLLAPNSNTISGSCDETIPTDHSQPTCGGVGSLHKACSESDQIKTSPKNGAFMQAVRWVTHPWKEAGLWRSSSPALAHPVATRLRVLTAARAARPLAFAATMELGHGGPDPHQLTRHAKLTAPASSAPELKQILLFLLQVFNLQSFGKVDIEVSCHCSQCFTEQIFRSPCSTAAEFEGPSLVTQTVKNLSAVQETRVRSWVGKIPREGSGDPRQYSCLENSMD